MTGFSYFVILLGTQSEMLFAVCIILATKQDETTYIELSVRFLVQIGRHTDESVKLTSSTEK